MMLRRTLPPMGALLVALLSQTAAAAPQNGVLTGLSVVWNAAGLISIEPGEGYAAGNVYPGADVGYNPFAAAQFEMGVGLVADTPYYIYACYDTTTPGWTAHPVTTKTVPNNDGTPSVAVVAHNGDACDALFLGSILSDNAGGGAGLVPFVRTGEDVILGVVNDGCAGGSFTNWYRGGGAVQITFSPATNNCQLIAFDSLTGNNYSCNGTDGHGGETVLPFPRSASAMLVDWDFTNTDSTHYTDVPYLTPNPMPATYLSNYQLNLLFPFPGSSFEDYYTHTRVVPSFDAGVSSYIPPAPATTAQFMFCIDATPATGKSLTGYAIYRGYVESIGHLTHG
jgi:hypothetical protein